MNESQDIFLSIIKLTEFIFKENDSSLAAYRIERFMIAIDDEDTPSTALALAKNLFNPETEETK